MRWVYGATGLGVHRVRVRTRVLLGGRPRIAILIAMPLDRLKRRAKGKCPLLANRS